MGDVGAIAKGLLAAQRAAQAVAKDATNQFHRYKYASSEAILEEARQALNTGGVTVDQKRGWFEPREGAALEVPSQGSVFAGMYKAVYTIRCESEKEEAEYECAVILERGRPLDKALAGASTLNLAYYLRALLTLPREDADTAVDRRDDRDAHDRQKPPSKPSQPTTAAKPAAGPAPSPPSRAVPAVSAPAVSSPSPAGGADVPEAMSTDQEKELGALFRSKLWEGQMFTGKVCDKFIALHCPAGVTAGNLSKFKDAYNVLQALRALPDAGKGAP